MVSRFYNQMKMATKKVIEVDETSIVDLKAELFRKEQQFRKESNSSADAKARTSDGKKKLPVWSKLPKRNTSQSKTQELQDSNGPSEEDEALQKSRKMLEAKAALYEKMAKGELEDEEENIESGEGRFLVDFHTKIYQEVTRQQNTKEESEDSGPPTPPPSCPEEEWVEYVDSLGRSRRCLRKDLKELQEQDRELLPRKSPSPPTLLSDDMRKEILRKKWEEEEQEAINRPVGPVHYQNIQFDEVRNHGVGYYQFSKVEQERQKQMDTLKKLREETLDQRSRVEKIKDRRKAALETRLAKVRARKRGKTEETTEVVSSLTEDKDNEETKDKNMEKMEKKYEKEMNEITVGNEKVVKKPEHEEEIKTTRHNIAQYDTKYTYFKRRRDERCDEFAPPSFYYETTNKGTQQTVDKNTLLGGDGARLYSQPDEDQSSCTERKTPPTQEMQHPVPREEQSDNTNQKRLLPQYPPYPPPVGNLLSPFQPPEQMHNYPPQFSLPQEKCHIPLPYYPTFPPPQYYTTMPPPLHPPWLPSPCQQFPGQQVHERPLSSNTQNAENDVSITADCERATRFSNQVADFVSSLRPRS